MIRTSLWSLRALPRRPAAAAVARQWLAPAPALTPAAAARRALATNKRYYADNARTGVVIPSAGTSSGPPSSPSRSPNPTTTPTPTPTPAPKKKKGFFRRLRNFIVTWTLLGALAFGGGVWYSRVNDNFHDFFTEYVPYGEQAVLYLEELDYRKRFSGPPGGPAGSATGAAGHHVKVSPQSGASWRVADRGEPAGRQSSAVGKTKGEGRSAEPATVVEAKKETAKLPRVEAMDEKTEAVIERKATKEAAATPAPIGSEVAAAPAQKPWKAPEVDEPSRYPPASPVDPFATPDAAEPVVYDLVRMLNEIVLVINQDGASERYGPTVGKAKEELNKVGAKIRALKEAAEAQAADTVRRTVDEFEKAAAQLVARAEAAVAHQEIHWRHELGEEVQRLRAGYEDKVKTIQERERQLSEARANNRLLEQAVDLQRLFAAEVAERVERERAGRLARLEDLSRAVAALDRATAGADELVDRALRTQQLQVAVDAVRASLEEAAEQRYLSGGGRRPFLRELVALKEMATLESDKLVREAAAAGADGDAAPPSAVVDAAIASINPAAYQRGVAAPAELAERFGRVATEVRKASLLPEDAGVASHASSWLLSHLMFRKRNATTTTTPNTGAAAGEEGAAAAEEEDVETVLARTQAFLDRGDLDNAAREMNGLQGWAKALSRDWLAEVRKVLEVRQALDVIQTEARLQALRIE